MKEKIMKQLFLIPTLLMALLGVNSPTLAVEEKHDHAAAPSTSSAASSTLAATGTVKSVDAAKGKLVIDHDPIPALNWPRMVMDFQLVDPAMARQVKAGDPVKFEMREGEKGAYLITSIETVHAH
jgi:Cu/Ag efflux protein CusF